MNLRIYSRSEHLQRQAHSVSEILGVAMVTEVYPRKKFSGKRRAPWRNSSSAGQNHAYSTQDFGKSG